MLRFYLTNPSKQLTRLEERFDAGTIKIKKRFG